MTDGEREAFTPTAILPRDFRDIFAVMMNINMDELENAGVIRKGNFDEGGQSWKRFNDDPLRFVLKLDDQKLDALTALVNRRRKAKPQRSREVNADYVALFEALDQHCWLLNPDHMIAVAREIDCDFGACENVWWESDTNASGCRLSENGGYCPNELASMLRDAATVAKRLNEHRNPPAALSKAEPRP